MYITLRNIIDTDLTAQFSSMRMCKTVCVFSRMCAYAYVYANA